MDLSISQNFINNPVLLRKLLLDSGIGKNDVVYDIGAGKGAISVELSPLAKEVYAFELDPKLENSLKSATKDFSNVRVLMGDFLKYSLPEGSEYKVFSNIPFSITSEILTKLLFSSNPPKDMFVFVQKEAALRFMGVGEGTMISLFIKPFFEMNIVHDFSRNDFVPAPSVDIVLFRIMRREVGLVKNTDREAYNKFISFVLNQQKPTLKLRLNKVFTSDQFYRLSKDLKFSVNAQSKDLSLNQWLGLFNYFLVGVSAEKKDLVNLLGFNPISIGKVSATGAKVNRTRFRG